MMSQVNAPFVAPGQLPASLPIFPLAGVLLLPRGRLPLNIFEPRYLTMVEDAMAGSRLIGMIQPSNPDDSSHEPVIYRTGCAGFISRFTPAGDGRFLITLDGMVRFRVSRELEGQRGYRQVLPDWSPFAVDLRPQAESVPDRQHLLATLARYLRHKGMTANQDAIEQAADEELVSSLAMVCPLAPAEKQAMLEEVSLAGRAKLLITLLEMAILGPDFDDAGPAHRH